MSLALLRKELREHAGVLAVTFVLAWIVLMVMLTYAEQELGGRFVGLVRFSLLFGLLIPLVLANRLFVREYSGRTQLFLETLPIGRARVFATKWLLGCALTLLVAVLSWLAAVRTTQRTEVLSWSDAQGPLLAVAMFWLTLWCFAAMAGMLGRFRYVAWAFAVLLAYVLNTVAGIPIYEVPVLRLLGQDVQMARGLPDTTAFLTAATVASLSLAGAAALALWGSGAMASALARRMTARERVFVLVSVVAVLTVSHMLERKPEQPPFQIAEGERVDGRFATAAVMPTADIDAVEARRLARAITSDMDALIEALSLDVRPPIFILPQQGLDPTAMQRASMSDAEGIVLRVAPDAPRDMLLAFVGHSVVGDATRGRALREDRHVLLDGLTTYWAVRDDPPSRERWWLRAATIPGPISRGDLTQWERTSEALGDCVALALSFTVFDVLIEHLGREPTLELMRRLFRVPPEDARAALERRPRALLATAGMDWARLAEETEAALQAARARHRSLLAARSAVTARIDWHGDAGRGIEIETRVDGAEQYAIYYGRLPPWAGQVGGLPRLDVRGPRTVLPLSPARGDRVFVAIELDDPVLECPVRVAAERLELT